MEFKKGLMFLFVVALLTSFAAVNVSAVEGAPEDSLLTSVPDNSSNESDIPFKEIKDKAGMTPDQTFYFLDRAFDVFKSSEELADERAYELAVLANKSAEGEEVRNKTMEKARERYEKSMEKVRQRAERNEELAEKAANQSTNHLEVLSKVYDKVPEQAKPAIEKAMNNSVKGREDAINSLNKFNKSKAEKVQAMTNERIQQRVSEQLRNRMGMFNVEQAQIRALRMNIECGLFPNEFNASDLPQELRNKTEKQKVTKEEVLVMAREMAMEDVEEVKKDIREGNMTQDEIRMRVQQKIMQRVEMAKDTAETLNEEYGRGMGYWKNHYSCPSEKEIPGKGREDEKENETEIEVEIEDGKAEIEVEINDTETEFTLNTTNKDEIISEIMSRTGLSKNQIMKYIEFEEENEEKEDTSCETVEDCEDLYHIAVPGEWACVDNECVWKTKEMNNNDNETSGDTNETEDNETMESNETL